MDELLLPAPSFIVLSSGINTSTKPPLTSERTSTLYVLFEPENVFGIISQLIKDISLAVNDNGV